MRTILLWVGILLSTIISFGQTPEQKAVITANYDQEYLHDLAEKIKKDAEAKREEALEMAAINNWPITIVGTDGSFSELMFLNEDGSPSYYKTFDVNSAKSTRTDYLRPNGGLGLNLEGEYMEIGVWDSNRVLLSHNEFQGRAVLNDNSTAAFSNHATWVTGILIAGGVDSQAKGMAPKAKALTNSWIGDYNEVNSFAAQGGLVSNHSYGDDFDYVYPQMFGAYNWISAYWDSVMNGARYYLMVAAVGNNGMESHAGAMATGYDNIGPSSTSKNALIIGIAGDATLDTEGNLISVDSYGDSSQGPTDDLRIKPDLCGDGVNVYSCIATGDSDYIATDGSSSAASPNVAGSLLLLQEHSYNVNGNFMRAATLKGLVLHTADDMLTSGPDAISGWGLLNAKRAAETISGNGITTIIDERTLEEDTPYIFEITADEAQKLSVSISWTDAPGTVQEANPVDLNNTTPRLVNNLDMIIYQGSTYYFPYSLQSATTTVTNGNNSRDPFERIDLGNATGVFTVEISNNGSLTDNQQDYSLIITGARLCTDLNEDIVITETVSAGESEMEEIRNSITAINTIENTAEATYKAGEVITLENNFFAITGSNLHVAIQEFPCSIMSQGQITGQRPANQNGTLTTTTHSIAEIENSVLLYPNPASDTFTVDLNQGNIVEIIVKTFEGKHILTKKANDKKCIVDINNLAKGIYIVITKSNNNETFYKKLIIE